MIFYFKKVTTKRDLNKSCVYIFVTDSCDNKNAINGSFSFFITIFEHFFEKFHENRTSGNGRIAHASLKSCVKHFWRTVNAGTTQHKKILPDTFTTSI